MRHRFARRLNAVQMVQLPFAFDTPGLSDGAGVDIWTPTPGDVLLIGAWLEVITAWNGVTPQAVFAWAAPVSQFWLSSINPLPVGSATPVANYSTLPSGRITTTDPLQLFVTRDGTPTGADPGATQGEAILFLPVSPA